MENGAKKHPYRSHYHSNRDSDIIDEMVMLISLERERNFILEFCFF